MIRLSDVRVADEARSLVNEVLSSGQLSQGRMVAALEDEVAHLSETVSAVAVSSATVGLQLAVEWVAPKMGGNVIVPDVSFVASANAVVAAGFTPRFADVDDDGCIQVDHALSLIDSNTVAVMPVHLYGKWVSPVDWPVPVVEDAAQGIGLPITFGVVSLYGSKTVGAGEGGVVVSSDAKFDDWLRVYRNQGRRQEPIQFGLNFRLTDLQAAVALGQLAGIEWRLATRLRNAHQYLDGLGHVDQLNLPSRHDSVWHQFTVRTDRRDELAAHLRAFGVETGVHYRRRLSDYPWLPDADTPNARRFVSECLQLPVHEHVTEDDIQFVVDCIQGFFQ